MNELNFETNLSAINIFRLFHTHKEIHYGISTLSSQYTFARSTNNMFLKHFKHFIFYSFSVACKVFVKTSRTNSTVMIFVIPLFFIMYIWKQNGTTVQQNNSPYWFHPPLNLELDLHPTDLLLNIPPKLLPW